uniref:Coiled-coil domain-containing protein 137 n=1 Tax=Plectus sambesii TaxID=2011161 RepID=A0A914WCC2_9BILA
MARHRRIQKKKRNKLKSVDPFNRKSKGEAEAKAKAFNRAPKSDELDDQKFSRSMREIGILKKQAAVPSAEKKARNRQRNKIAEATTNAGFKQRPFEGEFQFMDRIKRESHAKVQEQLMKVHFNMAGRDPRAVEGEFKELDAKEAEKKKRKAAKRAAEMEAPKVKAKKGKKKANVSSETNDDYDIEEEAETSLNTRDDETADAPEKSGKIDRKKRIRMLKAEQTKCDQKELLLNAREVIPFGERADAPPDFEGIHRKMLKPGFSKAGSKQLLLKAMLSQPVASEPTQQPPKQKDLTDERERVIAAYRTFKKIRRQAQVMAAADAAALEIDDSVPDN